MKTKEETSYEGNKKSCKNSYVKTALIPLTYQLWIFFKEAYQGFSEFLT